MANRLPTPVRILLTPSWVSSLIETHTEIPIPNGKKWPVPARPVGCFGGLRHRLRLAWLVFSGQADALVWPENDPHGYYVYLLRDQGVLKPHQRAPTQAEVA